MRKEEYVKWPWPMKPIFYHPDIHIQEVMKALK